LISTTALVGYLDWPGAAQVFEMERTRVLKGKTQTEAVYGITSLTREEADATRRMALVREHWGIENRLHWVRDVTLGEDGCRVRTGSGAQVLSALRNAAVYLLGKVEAPSKAAATRRLCAHPNEAIALLRSNT
jgi:predicted transposase YbfD/YdcC